ncbi:hypothetical protein D3C72_1893100 [compost metagenome]
MVSVPRAVQQLAPEALVLGLILGHGELHPMGMLQLRFGVAEHLLEGRVGVHDRAVRGHLDDAEGRVVMDGPEALLAAVQGIAHLLGDILASEVKRRQAPGDPEEQEADDQAAHQVSRFATRIHGGFKLGPALDPQGPCAAVDLDGKDLAEHALAGGEVPRRLGVRVV